MERPAAVCFLSKDGRVFDIYNALETDPDKNPRLARGAADEVTILLHLKNPDDNWEEVGFKIKTYEVTAAGTALVDKLEGDVLKPILQCAAPCRDCQDDGAAERASVTDKGAPISVPRFARGYCTKCWREEGGKKYP